MKPYKIKRLYEDESYEEAPSYMHMLDEICEWAEQVRDHIAGKENLPAWVQDKITISHHNLHAIYDMYESKKYKESDQDPSEQEAFSE